MRALKELPETIVLNITRAWGKSDVSLIPLKLDIQYMYYLYYPANHLYGPGRDLLGDSSSCDVQVVAPWLSWFLPLIV